jgi:predicted ATPase
MFISHITLKNWKNFHLVDIDVSQRLFIIGPNASGKSNFLDALRFMRDITKQGGGLQYAVAQRGGISKIRSLSARNQSDIEISVTFNDSGVKWFYSLVFAQNGHGNHEIYVKKELIKKNETELLCRPTGADKADPELLTQTHLEQITTNKEFREISRFFSSIGYLHLVPQLLKYPEAFLGSDLPEDPFGKGFLRKIAKTAEKNRSRWLSKIQEAVKDAVPQLESLHYTEDAGIPHLEVLYKHWRAHGAKQNETQLSDGTLRLIGLLWSLFENPGLLLLEEPELSLHTAIVENLASILYSAQRAKKKQILLTTHSPDLLSDDSISLSEILMLTPSSDGTEAELASSKNDVVNLLKSGFSPAESVFPDTRKSITPIQGDLFD